MIVNAVLLEITDALTSHLSIDDFFWTAIWAALIFSLVVVVLNVMVGGLLRKQPASG